MLELEPCPFCGGKVSFDSGEAGLMKVTCPFCGVSTLWSGGYHSQIRHFATARIATLDTPESILT